MRKLTDDWHSRQVRKTLIEEYPYLLPRNVFTDEVHKDYDYTYINGEYNLPDGWFELFLQCCEDIREPLIKANLLDKFRFTQIKEKFGSMRLYNSGATKEVQDILYKYEFLSEQVCSVCGKPAKVLTSGYICPYCEEHVRGSMENVDTTELIDIKTSYVKESWSDEGTIKETVDCSDEWERYLKRIGYEELVVVEKINNYATGERKFLGTMNKDYAYSQIEVRGGNQLVFLDSGEIVPMYSIKSCTT